MRQTQEDEHQMTSDEMLLHVLGSKCGYFRGKGYGKIAPSKRKRDDEEVNARVQQVLAEARASMEKSIKAKVRKEVEEDINSKMEAQFEVMFQAHMASMLASLSQVMEMH